MRLPKWSLLMFNLLLCVAFAYVSISSFSSGATVWWIWGLVAIIYGYTTINRFIKGYKEGWSTTEIVGDERTWNARLVSCSIAFIYILIFLTVGIFTFYTDYLVFDPVVYMVLAASTSVAVFATAQIVQMIQKS
ncbi:MULTISPECIES: hypothetical protein [unclassified Sporosarcina]|uniref:hypothetical protein n=1 Tax=unclassified Sporosarcina TaxID=2647733 RepID=UPI00203D487C|nr:MULTISPECIES: hypothetical protein [unclassified Sporosarcina]GKV67150.1 hypothetical protein NCCP2331_33030 [Sporosarcina sp. NCCP-2331]GLB57480.1 hypothetical protein NCCP2378_32680 [Sporosarcina sp. NCCP-2378]